ncbi:MAG: hypothetical protein HYR84_06755 [Planctomycetes bacterium]|nr:hypothetical protein [Planctomycetota bacterium]
MFVLFKYIARRGIQPFCDEELEHAPPALKPNWQNLPSELSYLIDLAEAYGHSLSESDMIEFLENAHPNDLDALTRAAERMRLKGDSKRINKWLDEFPLDKYPEAAMVYSLLGVMDLAGLRFE